MEDPNLHNLHPNLHNLHCVNLKSVGFVFLFFFFVWRERCAAISSAFMKIKINNEKKIKIDDGMALITNYITYSKLYNRGLEKLSNSEPMTFIIPDIIIVDNISSLRIWLVWPVVACVKVWCETVDMMLKNHQPNEAYKL